MSEPDLSTLPQRMRYAADVLREAELRYTKRATENRLGWDIACIEGTAARFEEEDRKVKERIEELARDAYDAWHPSLCSWDQEYLSADTRDFWRLRAAELIGKGWHKK